MVPSLKLNMDFFFFYHGTHQIPPLSTYQKSLETDVQIKLGVPTAIMALSG